MRLVGDLPYLTTLDCVWVRVIVLQETDMLSNVRPNARCTASILSGFAGGGGALQVAWHSGFVSPPFSPGVCSTHVYVELSQVYVGGGGAGGGGGGGGGPGPGQIQEIWPHLGHCLPDGQIWGGVVLGLHMTGPAAASERKAAATAPGKRSTPATAAWASSTTSATMLAEPASQRSAAP